MIDKADTLIRTKLHLPFTRANLVSRPRLQARIAQGFGRPLTLITAPAGFGKTTLLASCIENCGAQVTWLSLDKDDNQVERFLSYFIAALQNVDHTIGNEAANFLAAVRQVTPQTILTSLINDLDAASEEIAMVLDDYQFINNQAVHEAVTFLLEHCPQKFHLVIATRSDPLLPLARMRARGQIVELRAADLSFTELEAAQYLNEIMGLHLDADSVAALAERTEGWAAGLQMAALSMRDREDIQGFIKGFSGTNRYILDYLLEEVLSSQPPEIQRFLLYTSILERLAAPLCDALLADDEEATQAGGDRSAKLDNFISTQSAPILEYLERANLFLVPLDDERMWYRYHHLFADLLRTQLHRLLGAQGIAKLHTRASKWHEQYGSILDAIHHASLASDEEMVERLIEQNYLEMMNRGEMSWIRFWTGKLSKELIYRRPWLCLYEAMNHCWFGQLGESSMLLHQAEKLILATASASERQAMQGYHAYVKSRITAMQGDTHRAIELCRLAREKVPVDNLALQIDVNITLGYEYFLYGDFANASQILLAMIRSSHAARAVNNPVAAYAILARIHVYQGQLYRANELIEKAERLTHEPGGQYRGVTGLLDVEIAALLYERNEVQAAHLRLEQSLDLLPLWGKADDLCLAYAILARIQLAKGNPSEAAGAVEKATELIRTSSVFSEARNEVETTQVRLWLVQGDGASIDRWIAAFDNRINPGEPILFEDELPFITLARILLAQGKPDEAMRLLEHLEESTRSAGRMGCALEIMLLESLAIQAIGESENALLKLEECLALAEHQGYVRVFLDEGPSMQRLLAQWLARASNSPMHDYGRRLLSDFEAEPPPVPAGREKARLPGRFPAGAGKTLIEPLSQRELEVLQHIALGRTNQEIARQLIVSPGTVKAHTSNIYRKLDVANRTEAVARARQLGLLR